MNKQELLEQYNKNYTEEEYFKNNVTYAFSQLQLDNAMKKLGANDKSELTSLFGYGDICLKSKAKEILLWVIDREQQKKNWLKSLMTYAAYCKWKIIMSVIFSIVSVFAGIIPYISVYKITGAFIEEQVDTELIIKWTAVAAISYFAFNLSKFAPC